MPPVRFNTIFLFLMGVSFLTAFVLPERASPFRGEVQGVFSFIAAPVHRVSSRISDNLAARQSSDPRSREALRSENEALRVALVNLDQQLEALKRRNAERDLMGPAREWTIPVRVSGSDSGNRQSLSLEGSSRDGIAAGQAVLYVGGVAGLVERAGLTGSQVRLITDPGFTFLVSFGRFVEGSGQLSFQRLLTAAQLATGAGSNQLTIDRLTTKEAADLRPGDWALLADPRWPAPLQGYKVGQITQIRPSRQALYSEVRLEPAANLSALNEVMVMTK